MRAAPVVPLPAPIEPEHREWNMRTVTRLSILASSVVLSLGLAAGAHAQQGPQSPDMTFFVTSVGTGKGADLGGLEGADRHCQQLAEAAGITDRTWHAYLSTQATGGQPAVNARDRIGHGPWQNVEGVEIAHDVDALHNSPNLNKETALSEKGEPINGRGDQPNRHDILTGSQPDGMAFTGTEDRTCGNWTKS